MEQNHILSPSHQKGIFRRLKPKRSRLPEKSGEILVSEGLINPSDIDTALAIQKGKNDLPGAKRKPLGMILCDLNLVTPMDLFEVLFRHNKVLSLDRLLVERKLLDHETMDKIKKEAGQSGVPLISQLINERSISVQTLQEALFDLFHIPFRMAGNFKFNPEEEKTLRKLLTRKESKAHRLLPLVARENTLLFGITDPLGMIFLKEKNHRFQGFRIKTVFIHFDNFLKLHSRLYQTERPAPEKSPDISLLLGYRCVLTHPEKETDQIAALYERYEILRQLVTGARRSDHADLFRIFLEESFQTLTQKTGAHKIAFSLKKEKNRVNILARPEAG